MVCYKYMENEKKTKIPKRMITQNMLFENLIISYLHIPAYRNNIKTNPN